MTATGTKASGSLRIDVVSLTTVSPNGPALVSPRRAVLVATVADAEGASITALDRDAFTVSAVVVSSTLKGTVNPMAIEGVRELTPGVYTIVLDHLGKLRETSFVCVVDVHMDGPTPRRGRAVARVDV